MKRKALGGDGELLPKYAEQLVGGERDDFERREGQMQVGGKLLASPQAHLAPRDEQINPGLLRVGCLLPDQSAKEQYCMEQGSKGARGQGGKGARGQGSKGARGQG